MEKIKAFLSIGSGSGSGYGSSYGSGSGDGDGDGSGSGSGYGSGSGSGYGSGYGSGSGSGSGDGDGDGSGYGLYIKTFDGRAVHNIDGVPTIIVSIVKNIAKGFILENDLTITPCYVAKGHDLFAHGETAKDAIEALQEKIYANMDTDEAIEMFLNEFKEDKKYPAKAFYVWHHRLTGSCEMGRNKFIRDHGFDLGKDEFTVAEFIQITKNDFGGDVIRKLEQAIKHHKGD